jgi:4-hydroxybenzoate polyprenyltransferase
VTPNWQATIQNCLAILAITAFALAKIINGNAALVAILAVVGVVVYPALRRKGGHMGSIGILALGKPLASALAMFLARLS